MKKKERKPIKDKVLINLAMTEDFLKQIDDYRYKHRFPTRAEAMRHLMQQTLDRNGKE